ncbi:hypothetical protein [Mycolicibacterium sp.]|uniref:hypothetical protein n=1 Tax=Mycolicibacterium sp. TaxID=2320850 RepID=UPI00356007AA
MPNFVLASEALASGELTRRELMRSHTKVFRNVYVRNGAVLTPTDRAVAAWLASGERAVLAGLSAAALHNSRWIPEDSPVEVVGTHFRAGPGIVVHSGEVQPDEIVWRRGIQCTSVERTAYDLGRHLPFEKGIIRVDALLNATRVEPKDVAVIAERYPGARHIRRLRRVLEVADNGAESPQETRVRLILVDGGLPRPATQIKVGRRRIDMGWSQWKVGVEYDGAQHWEDPRQYGGDISRLEFFDDMGWRIVRVVAEHMRYPERIVARAEKVLRARGWPG